MVKALRCQYVKPESGANAFFTFCLNFPSHILYDPLNKVKPYAGAFYMGVEAFEHGKKLFLIGAANAQAVVFYT